MKDEQGGKIVFVFGLWRGSDWPRTEITEPRSDPISFTVAFPEPRETQKDKLNFCHKNVFRKPFFVSQYVSVTYVRTKSYGTIVVKSQTQPTTTFVKMSIKRIQMEKEVEEEEEKSFRFRKLSLRALKRKFCIFCQNKVSCSFSPELHSRKKFLLPFFNFERSNERVFTVAIKTRLLRDT